MANMTSPVLSKTIEQIKAIPQDLQGYVLEFVRVLTGSVSSDGSAQPLAVKGTYQNGTVELSEAVNRREGQAVIVTFLEESTEAAVEDEARDEIGEILADCQISTGIRDLAHQHDHYAHGTPKRED